jgi:hypothetical protein
MKIYEFCMFHNEQNALDLKRRESAKWVDELHLCESNRTFRCGPRQPALPVETGFLKPHMFDGEARFHPAYRWGLSRYFPFFRKKKMARRNETLQRDHVHDVLAQAGDGDVIVLSDIDEILDPACAGEVIDAARRRGIVSVELHHTLFYLNLYSTNWHEVWPGSPPNYAYRLFAMTGAHFRKLKRGSDALRRQGEWGKLSASVPLLKGFKGFHHSWLGDEAAALEELQSYAHSVSEHRPDLAGADGKVTKASLGRFIRAGESIFPRNILEIRSFAQTPPLPSVREEPGRYAALIL